MSRHTSAGPDDTRNPAGARSFHVLVLVVLCSILLRVPGVAQEAAVDGEPIDHDVAADFLNEAQALEASSPWSGVLYGPLLFVDPATRYVVANQADSAGVLERDASALVFAGYLPEEVVIANTAVNWSGKRWTMLMWPLPAGYFARRALLGHEMFHRLAPGLGLAGGSPANEHLDTSDGRLWLRLELRALARALATTDVARRNALADALAFRSHRYEIAPGGEEEERLLELNEGLAEYTGIRVSLPFGARAGWAISRIESRDVQAAAGGLSRTFAYATGAAYGLLLDDATPGWIREADEQSDLAGLAAHAYAIDEGETTDARARMEAYEGARLERFELERASERRRQQAEYESRFVEGPVLTLPVVESFNYSFDPNAVTTLRGVGQVFATARVRADWGDLEVSGGVLLRRRDGNLEAVVVPAPRETDSQPLTGDGWELSLAEGWEIGPGERSGDYVVRRAR